MKFDDLGISLTQECLRLALLASLISVWVLVGLFYYLSRYSKKDHFYIWTGAWFCYALWLTLGLAVEDSTPGAALFSAKQACVSLSAGCLLWGSLRFLKISAPPALSSAAALFLAVWIPASPQYLTSPLAIHLPVFILLGVCTPFAGVCFLRFQNERKFAGMGMLSLALLVWVIYLGSYPFARSSGPIYSAGYFIAAPFQIFIAAGMVVVLAREIRLGARLVQAEIEAVRQEKYKVITAKEAYQHLYNRMLVAEETERTIAKMRVEQQEAVQKERLQAIGQMAGDVAHDINNALAPITVYSQLLLSAMPELPDIPRERLQRINQAAEQVAQMVACLREYYRPGFNPDTSTKIKNSEHGKIDRKGKLDPDLPIEGKPCRPLRILCIDDEPELRQIMHDVLELNHHQVTVAPGGREGLELFRARLNTEEAFEVVITDLAMPDIDGHHVARSIKADSPHTPIIMLTGWGTMPKTEGPPGPVDVVLGKPPRPQELNNLLSQITNRN